MFPVDQTPESDTHILIDQIETNKNKAISILNQYIPMDKPGQQLIGRQAGIIAKQKLLELP